ncbi:SRPBCC family protein [Microbacterium oleivorans]|uniref:SRPBCC family protein n=1 Tax=Microbacterium oleivorans TaxID=273677 RepID=UPI0020409A02|nr:SRPBCC family protein [Microbacterium oleivorans]MCM3696005.1 SRPBCC family protein [Microbacterium oleivorans]
MTGSGGTTFTEVTRVACDPATLFDLSLSIDAHLDSMRRSGERAVAGVTSGTIGLGETVTWRARHFGVMWTMTSKITALDRPRRFVDEQVRGPFRAFRHEHRFERDGDLTLMTDTVTLRSPLLGRIVEPLLLKPYLRRLIRSRNEVLVEKVTANRGVDGR